MAGRCLIYFVTLCPSGEQNHEEKKSFIEENKIKFSKTVFVVINKKTDVANSEQVKKSKKLFGEGITAGKGTEKETRKELLDIIRKKMPEETEPKKYLVPEENDK